MRGAERFRPRPFVEFDFAGAGPRYAAGGARRRRRAPLAARISAAISASSACARGGEGKTFLDIALAEGRHYEQRVTGR